MSHTKEMLFPRLRLAKIGIFILIGVATQISQDGVKAAKPEGNDWKDLIISSSEKKALDEFRGKVAHRLPEKFMRTEFYLIRWLRAKNFNQGAAQEMLFENVKWRQKNNMSRILHEDFSNISDDYALSVSGHDKKSRPLGTLDFGAWDVRAAIVQGKVRRVQRHLDYLCEGILQNVLSAQMTGKNVTRGRLLVNMEGLNLVQNLCPSCIAVWIQVALTVETHYPGFFEEIDAINAPPLMSVLMNAILPVVSKETGDSVKIFTPDKKKWMAYLDKRIDRDQRTENYGGTKRS